MPQLINVLKGEMKLVGIRPISSRFLNEFPEDIRKLRMNKNPDAFLRTFHC
jgi:lipopolysaccharide/colanic/teichoic acid biosynthesis glycosyltransferase